MRPANLEASPPFYAKLIGLVSSLFLILLLNTNATAQTTYPIEHQIWTFTTEDHTNHLEASFQVIQCDSSSSSKINLQIFNEKGVNDTTKLSLTIYKADMSDSTNSSQTLNLGPGDMLMPMCGSSLNTNLSFSVPTGYNPEKLKIKVAFN